MDLYLLTTIVLNYDPLARIVRRVDGECLIKNYVEEIREVFGLEPVIDYHEIIDFRGLEKEYFSRKDQVKQGALRGHLATIGNFIFVRTSTEEPFKKQFFNTRAIDIYMTLSRVFGEDE